MQQKMKQWLMVLVLLLLVACSQDDGSAAWRTYPDAVVNINQVDPAYRSYFRSQHASNYSLRDQREAFIAATRTARTPVPKYVPQRSTASPKKVNRKSKKTARRTTKSKGKKAGKSKAKGKKKAARKSTKRRR